MTPATEAALRIVLGIGVGPRLYARLIRAYEDPETALAAEPIDLASALEVGVDRARAIRTSWSEADVVGERERCERAGVRIVSLADPEYPAPLRHCADAPVVLWMRGEWRREDAIAVAVVGTRRCSPYGARMANLLGRELTAAGFVTVSGLARGIDTSAHRGALEAGGRTIAVIGSGFGHMYPKENAKLADLIAESGAVVSQFPFDVTPEPHNFPKRNVTIAALSLGVAVVEGDVKSGAMITAREAMEMGRDIFAVPGRAGEPGTEGPHRLIRDGARLITCAADIVSEFGDVGKLLEEDLAMAVQERRRPGIFGGRPEHSLADDEDDPPPADEPEAVAEPTVNVAELAPTRPGDTVEAANIPVFYVARSRTKSGIEVGPPTSLAAPLRAGTGRPLPPGLTDEQKRLVAPLSDDPMPIDALLDASGLEVGNAAGLLVELEMLGIVRQLPGKLYVRT